MPFGSNADEELPADVGAALAEFREGVARAIDYAGALDCNQINCLAGIAPKDAHPERLSETFIANLDYAARALKAARL